MIWQKNVVMVFMIAAYLFFNELVLMYLHCIPQQSGLLNMTHTEYCSEPYMHVLVCSHSKWSTGLFCVSVTQSFCCHHRQETSAL